MQNRIYLYLSIGLLVIIPIFTACTNRFSATETTQVIETINHTVTNPVETVTVTTTITTDLQDELKVHFIDVGQGDAILIDLDETEILIDGGGRSPGVVAYVDDYIDGTLEVMVATHPHADHIGGLIEVLNNFQVDQIWHNGDASTSQTYAEFINTVQSEGAEVNIAKRGDQINTDDLTFIIFNPYVLGEDTNNNSIVLHLKYGEIDFLFTGDAEKEAENDMLVQSIVPLPEIEILKIGHHGSKTASSEFFLEFTRPETAIYMAKVDNSYGHPHEETLLALTDIGAEIYGTDIFGTITITTDGLTYEIQTEKN
jgi:beta-lactamase superfamily II metal-dependent hydrolase